MRRRAVRWVVGLGAALGLALVIHPAHAVVAPEEPKVFRFPVFLFATWWDQDAGQTSPQFQAGDDPAHYQAILDGFGGNPTGSLTEYYDENSDGQFLVQVDVYGPYTSPLSTVEGPCYYGGIDPPDDPTDDLDPLDSVIGAGGGGAAGMTVELLEQADPDVDFSQYDNDGDGYVDFMGIVHSGADMAVTGDPCNTWSHALPLSAFGDIAEGVLGLPTDTFRGGLPTQDPGAGGTPVLIDRVFTMPEFDEKGGILTIGVAAHEMAHALGEPDYYAVNGSSSGDGDWDIMSGGSYLGNPDGSNPSWFNPATRVFQGWETPTIVHGDLEDYTLRPRSEAQPGYEVGTADPNLLLVPTRWIKVGDTDSDGHTWTDADVHGLQLDGDNGYVIEGFYVEYASRLAGPGDPIHDGMTRSPYFDRGLHGSGVLVWHFDYWRRSNTFGGDNNAQDDAARMQVDVEEWDFNDTTQEIASNLSRGESSDPIHPTATGITSGTHQAGEPVAGGQPQGDIAISGGPVTPVTPSDAPFTVDDNDANHTMTVTAAGIGDCILQLFRDVDGTLVPESDTVDSGSVGDEESVVITDPEPGDWVAEVTDFAACGNWSGTVTFAGPEAAAQSAADTWSNEDQAPTGWAFTNVRSAGQSRGLDIGGESLSPDDDAVTLDVLDLGDRVDVSPGYATPTFVVNAGQANAMSVPVFSNGGDAPGDVTVTVRDGTASGPVVHTATIDMGAYDREAVDFDYTPAHEGEYRLFTTVSTAGDSEPNDTQETVGWAGPADPVVLVVDDDGYTDGEDPYIGALAALGVPYAVTGQHPSAELLGLFDAVIWEAAIDRGPGQLDADDRGEIASYLDDGGRLWLASNRAVDAAEAENDDAFVNGYFGAATDVVTTLPKRHTVAGTGDIFPESLSAELLPYPIRPFSDLLTLSDGAFGQADLTMTVTEANKLGLDGKGIGTRVVGDAEHGNFRTVLTTFSLSQATDPDTWVAMTRDVLDDFDVETGQYDVVSDDPLVFQPDVRFQVSGQDTPVRAIVLGGTSGQPVSLNYRVHGAPGYTTVAMARASEPGTYSAVIPGEDVTPSGVDYFLHAGTHSTFDPAPARTGQLAHEIAVALPEVEQAPEPTTTTVTTTPTTTPVTGVRGPVTTAAVQSTALPRTGGEGQTVLLLTGGGLLLLALAMRRRQPVRG